MKYLIVGLGNMGSDYDGTRHNIGFDVVDQICKSLEGSWRLDTHGDLAEVKYKCRTLILLKPNTYMNLSGKAVKYWLDKEKIELQHCLVIVDEIALPLDKIRLRPSGSDAGHNGLKSLQESLGTQDYPRLRFGIGNDYPKGHQADYVLGKWKKDEEPLVKLKIDKSVEIIESFAAQGIALTMNQVNNQVYSL